MKIIHFFILFIALTSCSKQKEEIEIIDTTDFDTNYFPMTIGNKWFFNKDSDHPKTIEILNDQKEFENRTFQAVNNPLFNDNSYLFREGNTVYQKVYVPEAKDYIELRLIKDGNIGTKWNDQKKDHLLYVGISESEIINKHFDHSVNGTIYKDVVLIKNKLTLTLKSFNINVLEETNLFYYANNIGLIEIDGDKNKWTINEFILK